jgi:MFS family permease
MPFYVAFVQLPQRFQNVNFTTAERAGILLLPTTLMVAVGAMAGGLAANKLPAEYILIAASAMVCVATGLLSSLPTSSAVWSGIYGYQVLMGLGLGASSPPYYMLLATSIEEKDISVGTGALNMMRTFGGCVAVAICSAVHQEFLGDRLPQFLSPQQIGTIQSLGTSMAQLSPAVKERVGEVFGASFNRQFLVMLAFAALNLLVAVVITLVRWKKGVLGVKPERSEANEFTNVAEKRDDEEKAGSKTETSSVSAKPSAKPRADVDERSVDKV